MEKLKENVAKVLKYSQGIEEVNIEPLMNSWQKAKEKFITLFDGKLIYEFSNEVQFELSQEAKKARLNEFISTISNVYNNFELAEFLSCNFEDFYQNRLSKDYNRRYYFGKKITKGTKIIKAFKEFETDGETLRRLQDAASTLIQENKVKGKLCLSVHPLDFLSSSENTYHWHSCHHLQGEYRAGNLSYMTDNVTIICYLKGEEQVKLPSFPEDVLWNSKKWRTLLFIHPQNAYMIAGRQYPFESTSGLNYILQAMKIIGDYKFNGYNTWRNNWFEEVEGEKLDTKHIAIHGTIYPDTDLIIDGNNSMAYNDLLHSTIYLKPYITLNENLLYWRLDFSITIGSEVKCIHCGKEIVEHSNTMLCTECDLEFGNEVNDTVGCCDLCGRRMVLDDGYDVDGYDTICPKCYEEYCFNCARCGCTEYKTRQHWNKELQDFICDNCQEELDWYENEDEESEEIDNGSEGECCESDSN